MMPRACPPALAPFATLQQWTPWRWAESNGRRTKVPDRRSNAPAEWLDFAQAVAAGGDGVGLELLHLSGFAAIDLDNVIDEHGDVLPWAQELCEDCGSYVERTPSGRGLRILGVIAQDFAPVHRRGRHPGGGDFELFVNCATGRFITVTGDRWDDAPDELADVEDFVLDLMPHLSPERTYNVATENLPAVSGVTPAAQQLFAWAMNDRGFAGTATAWPGEVPDRSVKLFANAMAAKRIGMTPEQWVSVLPLTVGYGHVADRPDAKAQQRAINRAWGRSGDPLATGFDVTPAPASAPLNGHAGDWSAWAPEPPAPPQRPDAWTFDAGAEEPAAAPAQPAPVEPYDLFGNLSPPDFPAGGVPPVLEDFAAAQARLMGVDPGGLAVSCLAVASAALPDRIKLRAKRYDEHWREPARLWTMLVGGPSTKKSPIISAAAAPLKRMDADLFKQYRARKAAYDALSKEDQKSTPKPPHTRLRLEDTTPEAAQEIFEGSPEGLLVLQDELTGWFGSMGGYSAGKGNKDRGFWLQAFNGGEYVVNRVGRGSMFIENLSCSLLGGVQPEVVQRVANDGEDDGLMQRFLPLILKDASAGLDEPLPAGAWSSYAAALQSLNQMRVPMDGELRFDSDAQDLRADLAERHVSIMRSGVFTRKFGAHVGKYDGIFVRLCTILHCLRFVGQDAPAATVTLATAEAAERLLHGFFIRHAAAFYSEVTAETDELRTAAETADFILAHRAEAVSSRDLARGGPKALRKAGARGIAETMELLCLYGWADPVVEPNARSISWRINPRVHDLFAARARAEQTRRAEARAVLSNLDAGARNG